MTIEIEHFYFYFFEKRWNWTLISEGTSKFHARINVIQVEINHIMWVNKKNDI